MKHRLFIAIDLPRELTLEIAGLQGHLFRFNLPINWEPVEKLHITVSFLGRLTDEQLGGISRVASYIAAQTSPFTLTPSFLDTLYRRHESSLVQLLITQDEDKSLTHLYERLAESFRGLKIPQPTRFEPHITIGRLKKSDPQHQKSVLDKISAYEFTALQPFIVDHLTLYESFLTRAGSHFQRVGQFKLQSPST